MIVPPPLVLAAEKCAAAVDFELSCSRDTGLLLRTLAAGKPGGVLLELGTGVGVGAAWMLDGMGPSTRLITIEKHPEAANISREVLADDPRCEVINADAREWLEAYGGKPFDLIFADIGVLKYERRDLTLSHLAVGGMFVADDLLPQPKWVDTHPARVERFHAEIIREPGLCVTFLACGSGIAIATRTHAQAAAAGER